MGKRVDETLKASVQVKLTTRAGAVLFEDTGRHAGLEVLNHPALLKLATR